VTLCTGIPIFPAVRILYCTAFYCLERIGNMTTDEVVAYTEELLELNGLQCIPVTQGVEFGFVAHYDVPSERYTGCEIEVPENLQDYEMVCYKSGMPYSPIGGILHELGHLIDFMRRDIKEWRLLIYESEWKKEVFMRSTVFPCLLGNRVTFRQEVLPLDSVI